VKNLKLILFVVFSITFFSFAKPAHADLVMPQPADNCQADEEYFREDKIDPEKYKNIRPTKFKYPWTKEAKEESGYCVNRKEYCAKIKNFCGLRIMLKMINDPLLHVQNLLINFILNNLFLVAILMLHSQNIKKILQKTTISKMGLITLIGYFWDFIFIVYIGPILMIGLRVLAWPHGFGHSDLQLSSTGISFVLVFIFTTLTFYFLVGKKMFQKKIFLTSALFGFLSNPVWLSLSIFIESILQIFSLLTSVLHRAAIRSY